MQRLSEFYYGYSAAVADIDRDGNIDVISGPYYYLGPAFTVGRQYYAGVTYNPTSEYPLASMVNLAYDWTGDGWPDVLNMSGNAGNGIGTLYVNPNGENRRWDTHVVLEPIGNEETLFKDIDGDGRPEVIHAGNDRCAIPSRIRRIRPASGSRRRSPSRVPGAETPVHGMGVGDINGDGRADYVTAYGWWEQPAAGQHRAMDVASGPARALGGSQGGAGGAEMGIYDVNGDTLNDVVTALEGHGFGLAWYEQKRDAAGRITFVQHIDHGQRARQERRRRLVHAAARRHLCRRQPGRHPGHGHRQAAPLALPVHRPRQLGHARGLRLPRRSKSQSRRVAPSSCPSSSTTARASARTSALAISTRTGRRTSSRRARAGRSSSSI